MILLKFLELIFCFTGFFLGIRSIVEPQIKKEIFQSSLQSFQMMSNQVINFYLCLCFFISVGFIGLVKSLLFYLNFTPTFATAALIIFALMGLVNFFTTKKRPLNMPILRFSSKSLTGYEKIAMAIVLILFTNYLYRATVPWFDQDEIAYYGLYTKLIAAGWNYDQIFNHFVDGFPRFGESFFSLAYNIDFNTWAPRFLKLFLFGTVTLQLYFFMLIISIPRFWALITTALFLSIPEFSYLATSLKVDAALAEFELCALLTFLFIFTRHAKKSFKRLAGYPVHLLLCCLVTYMAVATRLSGAYLATVMTLVFLVALYFSGHKLSMKLRYLGLLALIAFLFSHPYLGNLIKTGNPLFPFQAPWPFQNGLSQFTVDEFKNANSNIQSTLPAGLYHLYLIIHMAFGFEATHWDFLSFLPHAASKGVSFGWHSPLLLIFFLTPFLMRKDKLIFLITMLFFIIFTFWSKGLQFSRVFLATSSLCLITSVYMANQIRFKKIHFYLKTVILGILFIQCSYQLMYSFKKFSHSGLALIDQKKSFESKNQVYKAYNAKAKSKGDYHFMKQNDLEKINQILDQIKLPLLWGVNIPNNGLHIFFPKAMIAPLDINSRILTSNIYCGQKRTIDCIQSAKEHDCSLVHNLSLIPKGKQKQLFKTFPHTSFVSQDGSLELLCRKNYALLSKK